MSAIFKECDEVVELYGLYFKDSTSGLIIFEPTTQTIYDNYICDDVHDMDIIAYYRCLSNKKVYECIYVTELEVVYFDYGILRIGNIDNIELSYLNNNLIIISDLLYISNI